MRKKLTVYYLLFLILFQSCSSFSKGDFRNDFKELTPENYTELNGIYYFYPQYLYEKKSKTKIPENSLHYESIFAILSFSPQRVDSITIPDEREKERFELKFKTKKELRMNYIVNGETRAYRTFNGKIKNGFFYLDNKKAESWGIPLLYGGRTVCKHRIGMSKNGNLIVNSVFTSGGSFLIIFSNGTGNVTSYEIEKTK
jgi:hypothetical protein